MKNMREVLDMSTQISKDPKWKDKKSNELYHIPTFIYIICTAIFTYIIFSDSLEIKSTVNLAIINIVAFLSLALSVRYLFYGMVYAKTEEISLGEYILRSVPGLLLLIILPFVSDILLSVYTLLGKFMAL
ncbi:prenyltransferase [Bacillus cereus group sp. BfR-BA-01351]|uniref:prenyltransferase n=1 Tax=Bacillus cereus group sp. BfR-BA-01351 TaxID=2920314 RepID=UPI001F5AB071|nr:prenyltransferase [Bacillus cereus group sp. BfR-BA-01351]